MVRSKTETGSLVFGVISVTVSGLAILAFATLIVYVITQPQKQIDGGGLMPYTVNVIVILVVVLINFIFSVLLVNGVRKSKPKQVLAYFAFGVIVVVISTAGAISWVVLAPSTNHRLVGSVWLLVSLMYAVVLAMVFVAYTNIRKAEHKRKPKKEVITLKKNAFDGLLRR